MEEDVFGAVVEVEREIHQRLATERSQAEQRIAALRGETEERVAREEARLERELATGLSAAREDELRPRAREMVAAAVAQAERLGRLEGERLTHLLEEELARILPEK